MEVLFAASECVPFVKTGGLGDVIGSLPKALEKQGIKTSVILPKYGDLPKEYKKQMVFLKSIEVPVGWRRVFCGIEMLKMDGIHCYFLDNEYYFKRHGSYGFFDDGERFAFFSRAILEAIPHLQSQPDIIHCHDWQTGPISVLLKAHYQNQPLYKNIKTVFTIHNLRYQGNFSKTVLSDLLDLSELYFHIDGIEYHGNVSYLKAGLAYADYLTTVSPTYAKEIQMPYFGEGLDGFLQKHANHLIGIINGIDYDLYNPQTDECIFSCYEDADGKWINKVKLQEALHLPSIKDIPVIAMVTRLVEQKGIDLVLHVIHEIMNMNVQLIILGTGAQQYETTFKQLSEKYSDKLSYHGYFDETLARKIYAGSDLFLMPSKFEPCGIGQLLALRYGTLPIVRETGGLYDTVIPYNEFKDEGYGFSFTNYNAHDMLYTLERAVWLYRFQPKKWKELITKAMALDFSWEASANKYKSIYEGLFHNKLIRT
ncbi:glycogen synthase GlgA [Bacillus sp. FJAT-49736]|uniref:glycogen synthase GlgA n=1 Tax=Bacillus sp. FJAT-49736 TaxID=2833582 RepID=UPI001BC91196|nr:glycogen synthase GlgA [Bacillus sp. FJAT-49736]MBS4173065.1 glycogen synthase GlgA [Bacillus sp. FJAT-49736]